VQAEEGFPGIPWALVDIVQAQRIGPLQVARFKRPIRKIGKPLIWRAQGLDQWCILPAMAAPSKPVPEKDERAERLAAALRENLKRRKAQARAKGDVPKPVDKGRRSGPDVGTAPVKAGC
jgi:hypothetical protein